MHVSKYISTYKYADRPGKVVVFVMRRGAIVELSEGLWNDALSGDLSDNERCTLQRMGILVEDLDVERQEMLAVFDTANARSRKFTALVTLTLECNLACPYCYEEPFRGDFAMSDATADLLIDRITEKMKSGMDVAIDFYGGEALLALPTLKRIAQGLYREATRRNRKFEFNLVTNGTLLDRVTALDLAFLGLRGVKITLDGPKDIHDQQRPYASGNGSFDAIIDNIKATHDLVKIQLGGNFTRNNYRRFPELLDQLLEAGITPDKLGQVAFNPITPKCDGSMAGDFSATCSCTSEPWLVDATLYLREEILKRGFQTPKPLPSGCMVEFSNDLVVAHDGGLYKCPAFMGDVGLRIGSLATGIEDYTESHNLNVWKTEECLECKYLPFCYGGCRYLRRLRTGAIDGVDCRKEFLDGVMSEFIRQDLSLRK